MKKSFKYKSSNGKNNIHAIIWTPETEPIGVVQITHGMVEHMERYDEFANFLCSKGFVVTGNDHLGHGKSIDTEDELGFMDENNPANKMLYDMNRLRSIVSKQYPELPYFMLGHSMGSYLMRKYIVKYGQGLQGVILTGTGYEDATTTSAGLTLIRGLAKKNGWHYRSKLVENMTHTTPYLRFDLTGEDRSNSWITRDEEITEKYYTDPLCAYTFTLNGYEALLTTVQYVCNKKNIEKIPKKLPLLIASGSDDPVGNMTKGVTRFYDLCIEAGIEDVELSIYEGMRHEILNEIDRDIVYDDIYEWLMLHMQGDDADASEDGLTEQSGKSDVSK